MVKRTIALQVLSGVGVAALSFALAGPAAAEEKLNIVYTHHSSASNPFWQAVKKGFDDACAKIQANCQMVFTQTEGSVDQEVANQQAALARKPDALITTLVDNNAFVANLKDAKAKGVIVIASNVDATEGPELELRQAFVGQNFVPAGHDARHVAWPLCSRRRARSGCWSASTRQDRTGRSRAPRAS